MSTITDETGQFYLGMTYLAQNKPAAAISLLERINQQPTTRFFAASQWYLALAYLKTNQRDKAIPLLKLIIRNEQHSFRKKASDIINLLEN